LSGSGRAIVCAVGKNTLREVVLSEKSTEDRKKELCIEDDPTPEQNRLSEFGKVISTFAWISALVIFAVLMIYWLILMMVLKQPIISEKSLSLLLENFMVAVAILIVSVPEGLPLAVSIAMAFSTDRLKEDHLLIKKL
jgi:magnesium-transporting ATPase (P-type)